MATTLSALKNSVDDAIGSSDWATAEQLLIRAKAMMALTPDSAKAQMNLTWDRKSIIDTLVLVKEQLSESNDAATASSGVKRSKVHYASVTD